MVSLRAQPATRAFTAQTPDFHKSGIGWSGAPKAMILRAQNVSCTEWTLSAFSRRQTRLLQLNPCVNLYMVARFRCCSWSLPVLRLKGSSRTTNVEHNDDVHQTARMSISRCSYNVNLAYMAWSNKSVRGNQKCLFWKRQFWLPNTLLVDPPKRKGNVFLHFQILNPKP